MNIFPVARNDQKICSLFGHFEAQICGSWNGLAVTLAPTKLSKLLKTAQKLLIHGQKCLGDFWLLFSKLWQNFHLIIWSQWQESKLFFYRADVVTSSTRMRTRRRRQLIEFSTRRKDPKYSSKSSSSTETDRLVLNNSLLTRTRNLSEA